MTHSVLETGTFEFINKDNIRGRRLVPETFTRSVTSPLNEQYVCSSETFIKIDTEDIFVNVDFK